MSHDAVDHPAHYTAHPSGVECIAIAEHMNFCIGNAIKYLWRAGLKGDAVEDLEKARWYVEREIQRLKKGEGDVCPGADRQSGCQTSCQSGCEATCESSCETACESWCEAVCQAGCEISREPGGEVTRDGRRGTPGSRR